VTGRPVGRVPPIPWVLLHNTWRRKTEEEPSSRGIWKRRIKVGAVGAFLELCLVFHS